MEKSLAAKEGIQYHIRNRLGQNVYTASRDPDECCHIQVLKDDGAGANNSHIRLDTVNRYQSWPSIVV